MGDFGFCGRSIGFVILKGSTHNSKNSKEKFYFGDLVCYGKLCWRFVSIIVSSLSNFLSFNMCGLCFTLPILEQMSRELGVSSYVMC
jgi:hypothetical protein